jgi:ribosomal subunit interface protein
MKVILRGVHLTLTDAIKQHVQTHLVEHLKRLHDSEAVELEIHLRDTNGTKGGLDKECSVTLRLPHGHPIHVTELSEDIYKSIDLARDRVENSAKRLLERSHDKRHQTTPSDLHSLE